MADELTFDNGESNISGPMVDGDENSDLACFLNW